MRCTLRLISRLVISILLEQVMSADSGDGETTTQSPTFTPTTTDIQPATGTDAISALVGTGAEGITRGLRNSGDGNAGTASAGLIPTAPLAIAHRPSSCAS